MQEIRDRVEGITRIEEKFKFQLVVKEVSDYLNNKRLQLRFRRHPSVHELFLIMWGERNYT